MRLVSLDAPDGPRAGLLRDGRVFELRGAPPGGLQALLAAGPLGELELEPDGEGVALDDAPLLPPIARPGKVLCIGLNYRAHAEEQGRTLPRRRPSSPSSRPRCARTERP